ncbi:MAG: hypothetical protein HY592_00965 [Candidatus Omnitrophica bacterium]|nr:hypothetical protein [Candidatus Omnitrophota bacterium]
MDSSKKALILYAAAGHGHEKAARALEEAYRRHGAQARCVNVLAFTPAFFGSGYEKTYLFLIRHTPWLWGFFYYLGDHRLVYHLIIRPLRRVVNAGIGKRLTELILAERPSVIISTHFLATEVAGHLKLKSHITAKVVTVVTDYLPHAFWLSSGVDHYVVALPETKAALEKKGVVAGKIKVLGIPIEEKFSRRLSSELIRQRYGLPAHFFTVLLTSGGAAIGPVKKLARTLLELDRPVGLLVVCGTNDSLRHQLTESFGDRQGVKIFGFVDNMDELMEASDIVVGKAGGLTVSECMAKGRPMILFRPIPGQESRNAGILGKYIAGVTAHSVREVRDNVKTFIDTPQRMVQFRHNVREVARPHAAEQIFEWLNKL